MKEIKFRGKCVDNDEYVYGYLIKEFSNSRLARAYIYHNLVMHEVDPNSIAQFVGHDSNGKEVYEGDILIDDRFTNEYQAHLFCDNQQRL